MLSVSWRLILDTSNYISICGLKYNKNKTKLRQISQFLHGLSVLVILLVIIYILYYNLWKKSSYL